MATTNFTDDDGTGVTGTKIVAAWLNDVDALVYGQGGPSAAQGTWTPVFTDGTNNATMGTSYAYWSRVGRQVFIEGLATCSALGSVSGGVLISGLPVAAQTTSGWTGGIHVWAATGLAITAGMHVTGGIQSGATKIQLQLWDTTSGVTQLQHTELSDDGALYFYGQYIAAES